LELAKVKVKREVIKFVNRMASGDGHVISGNYEFYLGHPSEKISGKEKESCWRSTMVGRAFPVDLLAL